MSRTVPVLVVSVFLLLASLPLAAQEVTVSGTVTDVTGGVLPGVTVTARHEASGNVFLAVTDERGAYRLLVRTGRYVVTAELSGFRPATASVNLALGQEAIVDLKMSPEAIAETVTVTGLFPLVNLTQSDLSDNIDVRQMQDIPINGRNWMQLALLASGSRGTGTREDAPVDREYGGTVFQMVIDGQQVTQTQGQSQSGQPRYSRDAIAEFEVATSRFDATQGRSSGVLVNAVTKAGTNTYAGTLSGFFRSDRFKAADPVVGRVLDYSNQQYSATFGGPLRHDRAHVFGYYEFEREPQTVAFNSPYAFFNIPDVTATRQEHKFGVRFDTQFNPTAHLMVRGNRWTLDEPFADRCAPGATRHPSTLCGGKHSSDQLFLSLTKSFGPRTVNELKAGYNSNEWDYDMMGYGGRFNPQPSGCAARNALTDSPQVPGLLIPLDGAPPSILLRGYSLGTVGSVPHCVGENTYSVRDSLSITYHAFGDHAIRTGGEYLHTLNHLWYPTGIAGVIDASTSPVPTNLADIFPVWNDWTTWDVNALSPITRFYRKSFGDPNIYDPVDIVAAWLQDDWRITSRLTLNLGVRYDLAVGAIGDRLEPYPPFRPTTVDSERLNLAPRLGFAYGVNDRTVIRGGWGKYYAQPLDYQIYITQSAFQLVVPTALNDGRPTFAADPYNGQIPTYESILAAGTRRDVSWIIDPETYRTPYSYQGSLGVQRQIGQTMSFTADYSTTRTRGEVYARNANLSYSPSTGVNYPFTDISRLPYPEWGVVNMMYGDGYSNYHALQASFTKRFSERWQASANYALSGFWDATAVPDLGFPLPPDLGGEYSLGAGDQRHRATVNGIWEIGGGVQISGLYFYGSGLRFPTSYGTDLRQVGVAGENRLRPNGTIVPRNSFVGEPLHRVDLRLQKRIPLVKTMVLDAIVEVFNAFNHDNFASYTTAEVSPAYGTPNVSRFMPYQPRMGQFAFRLAF